MSEFGVPIDERRGWLNRYSKFTLVSLCAVKSGGVMPRRELAKWRKDELVAEILRIEYPAEASNG